MKTLPPKIDFGARSLARQLVMQALYQWQLNALDYKDLNKQFGEDKDYKKTDQEYFALLLENIMSNVESLDADLEKFVDRPLLQLDPISHAILWLGLYEFNQHIEIPFAVVINEAVKLAKKFGAEDSHKFVNAVLEKAAAEIRSTEIEHKKKTGK
ncbi:MAG: transcription antitermination factor NusB [Gammaproteobacteria bacterium]|nr:transcription antitermination factor NusB [Gammaproteobacteria bacterium]NNC97714.1 transcription antitermination factor NusB [Gammaproteobacteria bacterium]NNM14050.1 transcription antitermination factor NusB [Gammaproteobacteria bacterium]